MPRTDRASRLVDAPTSRVFAAFVDREDLLAWLMEIHPGERFVYAANRVGTERGFQVDFDLASPVPAPAAPWGWED